MSRSFQSGAVVVMLGMAAVLMASPGCEEPERVVIAPVPFARADDLSTTRVRGGDNGLEVVHWMAPADATHVAGVLSEHGRGGTLPPETIDRLRRNGFVVAEVPTESLPSLLAELGGTLSDVRNWHGQIPEWRELLRATPRPGAAIYTGDRVQPLAGTSLRLAVRGWTVPMEDGGLFWLEMIPHSVGQDGSSTAMISSLAPRSRLRGTPFPDAGLSVVLDQGWSLILAPEPPPPPMARTTGPEVDPPVTLGALLMPVEELPEIEGRPLQRRTPVHLFIARLPEWLVPMPGSEEVARP
ncbi:MAG: hypothetical protein KF724_04725 [Phycisphaeraceae bacterium]|nr:hypothetical protein [Phycisphaeraceae bacterium]